MTITVTERDDNGQVHAHAGDTLDVFLAENATSGYRWELEPLDAKILELAGSDANYPGKAPGSGGTAHFAVRVRASGSATLGAKYWRSWEGGIIKRFSVKVDVR